MSGFARQLERNKMKAQLKKEGIKRTMPLSKYRFKTSAEIQKEVAEKITEQMIETAKQETYKPVNNE